ncbi:MAG: hypothetical protein A2X94_05240 [Bdellovibrionales bacterium GWB1_55_8]|nr:MAG: hypothetical protein A2X94_05240 [Bdellovibrionales bacterium GWB1_55_8]
MVEPQLQHHEAGTLLIAENDCSRKMFILKKGKVRVFKNYMNQRITLAILGEGEIFGELSFFDAEPRTASVEALTDVSVVAIDGEKATRQIAELPDWVIPIFRSVFHRFREADQKITVLQSMNEYQKKNFKNDTVGKTIYLELLRFIKTLEILYSRDVQNSKTPTSVSILQELDDMLGKRFIGLKVFWRLLKEYDFMDHQLEQAKGEVRLKTDMIANWKKYLASEVESERFLILSHPALAVLRRIVGITNTHEVTSETSTNRPVSFDELKLGSIPLYQEGIKELAERKLIVPMQNGFSLEAPAIHRLFLFQSILKNFDHTIVNLG